MTAGEALRWAQSALSVSMRLTSVCATTYDGHTSNVTAVGFQKDSQWIYSASEAGTIKLWDLGGQPRFRSMWERERRPVGHP